MIRKIECFKSVLLLSLITCASIGFTHHLKGQEIGVSASFFLPKNGYFSTPISPISFRGYGIDIGDYLALETGITLYRMSGLNVTSLPFESKKPLIGPSFTLMIPLELVLKFGNNTHVFHLKGGGFTFYSFDQKINEGNLDRALRIYKNWDVLNSDFRISNNIGFGIQFGGEYIFYINKNIGISFGASYYIGGAKVDLAGSMTGGTSNGLFITEEEQFIDSKVDYTGLEISLGLLFSN